MNMLFDILIVGIIPATMLAWYHIAVCTRVDYLEINHSPKTIDLFEFTFYLGWLNVPRILREKKFILDYKSDIEQYLLDGRYGTPNIELAELIVDLYLRSAKTDVNSKYLDPDMCLLEQLKLGLTNEPYDSFLIDSSCIANARYLCYDIFNDIQLEVANDDVGMPSWSAMIPFILINIDNVKNGIYRLEYS